MTRLLTSLIAGFVTGETRQVMRQTVRAVIFYAVAGLLALVGVAFLLGALFIEVAREQGPRDTALMFGGAFLGLALLIVLVHLVLRRVRRQTAKRRRNDELTTVATAAALAVLPALLKGKGALGLLAAPAAIVAYKIYRENSRPRREPPDAP